MKKSAAIHTVVLIILISSTFAAMTPYGSQHDGETKYKVEQYVEKGWNLLPCFLPNTISTDSNIQESNIKVIWMDVKQLNEYYQIYPENELGELPADIGITLNENQLLASSCWVNFDKRDYIRYITPETFPKLEDRELSRGWNFMTVTPEFMGKRMFEFKGSCNIEKFAFFQHQEWSLVTPELFEQSDHPDTRGLSWEELWVADSESDIGRGLLFYVSRECSLEIENSQIRPPDIPN